MRNVLARQNVLQLKPLLMPKHRDLHTMLLRKKLQDWKPKRQKLKPPLTVLKDKQQMLRLTMLALDLALAQKICLNLLHAPNLSQSHAQSPSQSHVTSVLNPNPSHAPNLSQSHAHVKKNLNHALCLNPSHVPKHQFATSPKNLRALLSSSPNVC